MNMITLPLQIAKMEATSSGLGVIQCTQLLEGI